MPTRMAPVLDDEIEDFQNVMPFILWATPSAAGPRPWLIALRLQILGIDASGCCYFSYPNLSFGMLGGCTLASWGP